MKCVTHERFPKEINYVGANCKSLQNYNEFDAEGTFSYRRGARTRVEHITLLSLYPRAPLSVAGSRPRSWGVRQVGVIRLRETGV
jgi:hypothetical protein